VRHPSARNHVRAGALAPETPLITNAKPAKAQKVAKLSLPVIMYKGISEAANELPDRIWSEGKSLIRVRPRGSAPEWCRAVDIVN